MANILLADGPFLVILGLVPRIHRATHAGVREAGQWIPGTIPGMTVVETARTTTKKNSAETRTHLRHSREGGNPDRFQLA